MSATEKRLIDFWYKSRQKCPESQKALGSRVDSETTESSPHGRRFQSLQKCAKAFLLFIVQRGKREPRQPAAVSALVHHVLDAGDPALGNDEFRSLQQHTLQLASLFVVTLAEQFVKRYAFLRERGGQRQNRSPRANRQAWIHRGGGTDKHLKRRRHTPNRFGYAVHISGAVLDADDVWVLGKLGYLGGLERNSGELRHGIKQHGNWRCIGHPTVMCDVYLRLVHRLVVIRCLHERSMVPKLRRVFRALDCFRSGFRARSGNEFLVAGSGISRRGQNVFHLRL